MTRPSEHSHEHGGVERMPGIRNFLDVLGGETMDRSPSERHITMRMATYRTRRPKPGAARTGTPAKHEVDVGGGQTLYARSLVTGLAAGDLVFVMTWGIRESLIVGKIDVYP